MNLILQRSQDQNPECPMTPFKYARIGASQIITRSSAVQRLVPPTVGLLIDSSFNSRRKSKRNALWKCSSLPSFRPEVTKDHIRDNVDCTSRRIIRDQMECDVDNDNALTWPMIHPH